MKTGTLALTVRVDEIPADGRRFRLEASAPERQALADELGVAEVGELVAEIEVRALAGGVFALRGTVSAAVVQTDVVTLEEVPQAVSEAIDVTLVGEEDAARLLARTGAPEPGDGEGPDVFSGGRIDLGALVKEHLALGLDPYPRAPGVKFPDLIEDDPDADASPFAALARLKKPED